MWSYHRQGHRIVTLGASPATDFVLLGGTRAIIRRYDLTFFAAGLRAGIDRQATKMPPENHARKGIPRGQAFVLFASLALAVTAVDVVADLEVLWGEFKRLSTCACPSS